MSVSLNREIISPDSDGQPMADNTKQFRWIVLIKELIIVTENLAQHTARSRFQCSQKWLKNRKNQVSTINSTHLEEIVTRLVEQLNPEQVILFGSHAYGTPTPDSDIDLLIIVSDSDQPRYRRSRIAYAALRGILTPVDVIVMTREEVEKKVDIANSLPQKALRQGKILYG